MKLRALTALAPAWLFVAEAAIGQSEYILTLEQGDRRFEFDGPVNCVEQRRGFIGMRLLAERFLFVNIEEGDSDRYFVNSLQASCIGLSGDGFRAFFSDNEGKEIRSGEVCAGDWYVRSMPDGGAPNAIPGANCELGVFWPLSFDIGVALAQGLPEMFDPARPARFAVVSAEESGERPESISADQAMVNRMRFPDEDFESCVAECGVLDSLQVPGCLLQGRVRDYLFATLVELTAPMPRVRLPKDSCGCMTFMLNGNGGIGDIDVLFANPAEVGDQVASAFAELEPVGAIPAGASCLAGMTVPFLFYER